MTKKFKGNKKKRFLASRQTCSIQTSDIAERSKFNFSYFTSEQEAGQDFSDWNNATGICSMNKLMDKLKEYTKLPLSYWMNKRAGGGGLTVLTIYGDFPKKSEFTNPKHIPHDVSWGRFRLGNKVRLIGFVIPENFVNISVNSQVLDSNTFYIVFLDRDHLFYKSEKK